MYEYYKPLRNFTRKLHVKNSLLNIWQLIGNINGKFVLPIDFQYLPGGSIKRYVYEWELALLAREIILNSGDKEERSLMKYKDFVIIANLIKKTTEEQSKLYINNENILHEVHRISQQQFPFQKSDLKIYRFLKIFRYSSLEDVFLDVTGLSIKKFFFLALSVSGNFMGKPIFNISQDYSGYGITNIERDAFFSLVTTNISNIREKTKSLQEYNENWSYTFNPLLATPLVVIDDDFPNMVLCPIVSYFNSRISEGLIFDIFRKRSGSEAAYGEAFEEYVFDITKSLITKPEILVVRGEEYYVGKNLKHGVDINISDDRHAMLVECKAKRLNLNSRYQGKENALDADLKMLAKFVAQNYKNIIDIVNNNTNWVFGGRELYPVVVSLMECYIWTEPLQKKLDDYVVEKLNSFNVNPEIIALYPYTLMTIEEYEMSIQVINKIGFQQFFAEKNEPEYAYWTIESFVRDKYKNLLATFRLECLHDEVEHLFRDFKIDD